MIEMVKNVAIFDKKFMCVSNLMNFIGFNIINFSYIYYFWI